MTFIENASQQWGNNTANVTDATVRARWQEIHDMLIALGLTEVMDTGRASDLSALTPNLAGSNSYGFRVYRFNDTLQATRPIYIKVAFYANRSTTSANVNYSAGASFTFCSGTDGAGTPTGWSLGTPATLGDGTSGTFTSGVLRGVYSAAQGVFGLMLVPSTTTSQNDMVFLERTRGDDGVTTNEGFVVKWIRTQASSNYGEFFYKLTSATAATQLRAANTSSSSTTAGAIPILVPLQGGNSLTADANTGIGLEYPFSYKPYPPLLGLICAASADFGANTNITVDRYGVSRTYKLGTQAAVAIGGATAREGFCTNV